MPRTRDAVEHAARVGPIELAARLALAAVAGACQTATVPTLASSSYGMTAMRAPVDDQNRNVPVRRPFANAPRIRRRPSGILSS
jgi:hypothetical protein